ncbi:MAG: hypothetical protein WC641_02100 [Patescibacteria group bacterium]
MKIYTHVNVDLDNAASVWAAREFIRGGQEAELVLVSANWDGAGYIPREDIAVDMNADGHGIKGYLRGDNQHSCFAKFMREFAPSEVQRALEPLIRYIDMLDTKGMITQQLMGGASSDATRIVAFTGLNNVFRAIKSAVRNDALVCERFGEILDGFLALHKESEEANLYAKEAEIVAGKVPILRSSNPSASTALFQRGYKVLVYIDGNSLGLLRENRENLRMDRDEFREIVKQAGEEQEWYAHPSGFLYCRGSRKAPAQTPSRVDPRALAEAAARLLG